MRFEGFEGKGKRGEEGVVVMNIVMHYGIY